MFDSKRAVMCKSNVSHANRQHINEICLNTVLIQLSMSSSFMHAFGKDLTVHFILTFWSKLFVLHLAPAQAMNGFNFFMFVRAA